MNRILVATTFALVIGAASLAAAATITQTQGFAGHPALKQTVEFDRFNPSYGQLVSAEWRLVLDIEGGSHTVDNDGMSETTVSVYLGARASLSSDDVKLLDAAMMPILHDETAVEAVTGSTLDLAVDNGDGALFDPTGPDARTHQGGYASATLSGIVNPSYLDDYIGTQLFQLQVEVQPLADLSDAVAITDQVTPVTAWPNVVLTYQYNPVPEGVGIMPYVLTLLVLIPLLRSRA